jgi:hypothetical protein
MPTLLDSPGRRVPFGRESVMMIHRATAHEMSRVRDFREMVLHCWPARGW